MSAAVGFDGVVGHDAARATLSRLLADGRLPHALLLHGPAGIGKGLLASRIAASLLCTADALACGACASCRALDRRGHPDLAFVRREKKKSASASSDAVEDLRRDIVVDQIRELTRVAALAPRLGARRVFVVDPADAMNGAAQNALLKTLEEPPGSCAVLLVAERPHRLLTTVRSRSFAIGLAPLPTRELAERLAGLGHTGADALERAALAEGRVGRALELDVEEASGRRAAVLEVLEAVSGGPSGVADLPAAAAALAGKTETTWLENVDLLSALLRDAARAATGAAGATGDVDAGALVHADLAGRLAACGRRLGPLRAARLIESIESVRRSLRVNVNRTLAAEAILAAIAGGPLP